MDIAFCFLEGSIDLCFGSDYTYLCGVNWMGNFGVETEDIST